MVPGILFCVFFFQAEDGIRDVAVTGVQTCALPISPLRPAGACIVETSRLWHCSGTMPDSEWRLLTTLSDLPSAQSLAEVVAAEGVVVRVMSDAGVLGQAAPSRIYVAAA